MKSRIVQRIQLAALLALVLTASAPTLHAQTYTVLYNFGSADCDPVLPENAGIIAQGRDGNFYSTAPFGGCYSKWLGAAMSDSREVDKFRFADHSEIIALALIDFAAKIRLPAN